MLMCCFLRCSILWPDTSRGKVDNSCLRLDYCTLELVADNTTRSGKLPQTISKARCLMGMGIFRVPLVVFIEGFKTCSQLGHCIRLVGCVEQFPSTYRTARDASVSDARTRPKQNQQTLRTKSCVPPRRAKGTSQYM